MAKFKLVPLADRVVVEPIEQEEVTASGIILPETAKEKPQRGKVLAAGPGKMVEGQRVAMDVKVGDVVIFDKWGGKEVKIDEKKYLIINESDILAKVAG